MGPNRTGGLAVDAHGCESFRKMPRRQALVVGSLGALGLSLGDFFRIQALAGDGQTQTSVEGFLSTNPLIRSPKHLSSIAALSASSKRAMAISSAIIFQRPPRLLIS
jgi:hypothetical protein